jgi:hypothetical protein
MRAAECHHSIASAILAPVLDNKANPHGNLAMPDLLSGRAFQVVDEGGALVGAYVLRGQGTEVWVQAAAGRASADLSDEFDALIARHAAGFETVAFRTYRRGLVRKAIARGYHVARRTDDGGYILRKKLK